MPAVKLIDFGVARLKEIAQHGRSLTSTHHLLGSMGYMAPEQFQNAKRRGAAGGRLRDRRRHLPERRGAAAVREPLVRDAHQDEGGEAAAGALEHARRGAERASRRLRPDRARAASFVALRQRPPDARGVVAGRGGHRPGRRSSSTGSRWSSSSRTTSRCPPTWAGSSATHRRHDGGDRVHRRDGHAPRFGPACPGRGTTDATSDPGSAAGGHRDLGRLTGRGPATESSDLRLGSGFATTVRAEPVDWPAHVISFRVDPDSETLRRGKSFGPRGGRRRTRRRSGKARLGLAPKAEASRPWARSSASTSARPTASSRSWKGASPRSSSTRKARASRRASSPGTTRARCSSARSPSARPSPTPRTPIFSAKRFIGRRFEEVDRGGQARPVQGRARQQRRQRLRRPRQER